MAVPCELCGTPTNMTGTKRCDSCWEAERHLTYIASVPKLRDKMLQTLSPDRGFFEHLAAQAVRLKKALTDGDKEAMWDVAGRIEALGAGIVPREDSGAEPVRRKHANGRMCGVKWPQDCDVCELHVGDWDRVTGMPLNADPT